MTEFPELQHALVDAARRRHGRAPRTWRLVRPVLVTAACAAAVGAVLMLNTRAPDDERSAAPAVATGDLLEQYYGAFRRPATDADVLPDVEDIKKWALARRDVPAFDPTKARLLVEDGALQGFVAGAPMHDRPAICVFLFEDRQTDLRHYCGVIGPPFEASHWEVIGSSWKMRGGEGQLFLAAVVDGIDEVVLTFADDSTRRLPVHDNAVYAWLERRPVSIGWNDADGQRHSQVMPPQTLPKDPPPETSTSTTPGRSSASSSSE